jgi:tetratricopeptide (TPR) repeat protein
MTRTDAMDTTDKTDKTKDAQQWYEKGKILARMGKNMEAIEAFGSALAGNPELAEAYFARSACHYLLGRYQQAAADLDAASLLGCRDAQFWSKYENAVPDDEEKPD